MAKKKKKDKKKKTQKQKTSKKELKKKKKKKKNIPKAKVYVTCSYNNTIITFTDHSGDVIAWSSSGCVGFTGSKTGTAYAATKAGYDAYDKASKYGVKEATVIVKGVGMGRRAAVKGLKSAGLNITSLSDHTPIKHGGCRSRKKPRGS